MSKEKVNKGDLIVTVYNKYTPRAIRASVGKIYGCFDPRSPHDHVECMFISDNNISDGSIGIVIRFEKCNSSLLTKTNDFSEKPLIDLWFLVLAFDKFEKKIKNLWVREKDTEVINKFTNNA
jgi:hypothetical protein